ncbi:MAG: UpxY family transcription antiterminator [Flavobacteriaceae bacterium]|nr:UpxY family transcription antiterminator [Flavobacteriaceae bacterium]
MELTKSETVKNWYAVFTKPRAEKKVVERLEENSIEVFLPLVKTSRQWSDRKKYVQLPLIPSYVFVHMIEKDLNKVLPFPGTVAVLKHLGKPAKVKQSEIDNLKILSDNADASDIISVVKKVGKGDAVMVSKGSFAGLIGVCIKEGNKHRVVVQIDSLAAASVWIFH